MSPRSKLSPCIRVTRAKPESVAVRFEMAVVDLWRSHDGGPGRKNDDPPSRRRPCGIENMAVALPNTWAPPLM